MDSDNPRADGLGGCLLPRGFVSHTICVSNQGRGAEMLSYGDAVHALTNKVSVIGGDGTRWNVTEVEDRGTRSWRVTLVQLGTGRTARFDLSIDAKLSNVRLP
jgi:hypothetical protein